MKKIIIILFAACAGLCGRINAQKYGHVDAGLIMRLLPEMPRVQASLDSFARVRQGELDEQVAEYKKIEAKLQKYMDEKAPQALIELTGQELDSKAQQVAKYQQYVQQEFAEKQQLLYAPLEKKIMEAIKEVCAEKGINYVFDTGKGVLLYWDEKDNINMDVRKKLGIAADAVDPFNVKQ